MKKVYLHMGTGKTGSTSFQNTCFTNNQLLQKQGFWYSIFNQKATNKPFINHSLPMIFLFDQNRELSKTDQTLRLLYMEQLTSALERDENLIISSEALAELSVNSLIKIRDFFLNHNCELHPIVIIRSPYSFNCSFKQEGVRLGFQVNFYEPIQQPPQIKNIIDVFGNQVNFLPYEKNRDYDHGSSEMLMHFIGIDYQKFIFKTLNISNSNLYTRVVNIFNKLEAQELLSYLDDQDNARLIKILSNKNKFFLNDKELDASKKILDQENIEFEKLLGKEFCDKKYAPVCNEPLELDELLSFINEKLSINSIPSSAQSKLLSFIDEVKSINFSFN